MHAHTPHESTGYEERADNEDQPGEGAVLVNWDQHSKCKAPSTKVTQPWKPQPQIPIALHTHYST